MLHNTARRNLCLEAVACVALLFGGLLASPKVSGAERQVIAEGLRSPESVAVGPDGRLYVTEIGKSGVDGDGAVAVIEGGKPKPFAKGLDDPKGLVVHGSDFYVADKTRVWRIDSTGTATVYAPAETFPSQAALFERH